MKKTLILAAAIATAAIATGCGYSRSQCNEIPTGGRKWAGAYSVRPLLFFDPCDKARALDDPDNQKP